MEEVKNLEYKNYLEQKGQENFDDLDKILSLYMDDSMENAIFDYDVEDVGIYADIEDNILYSVHLEMRFMNIKVEIDFFKEDIHVNMYRISGEEENEKIKSFKGHYSENFNFSELIKETMDKVFVCDELKSYDIDSSVFESEDDLKRKKNIFLALGIIGSVLFAVYIAFIFILKQPKMWWGLPAIIIFLLVLFLKARIESIKIKIKNHQEIIPEEIKKQLKK